MVRALVHLELGQLDLALQIVNSALICLPTFAQLFYIRGGPDALLAFPVKSCL